MMLRILCYALFLMTTVGAFGQEFWEAVEGVPGGTDLASTIAVSPNGTIYTAGEIYLYSSDDDGMNWSCELRINSLNKEDRRMKFLADGTPLWKERSHAKIKIGNEWKSLQSRNNFDVSGNTIYQPSGNKVYKSENKGNSWELLFTFTESTSIHEYRHRNGRHFAEYTLAGNRQMAELTVDGSGEVSYLRRYYVSGNNFQDLIVDECYNLHHFDSDYHIIRYHDSGFDSHTFSGSTARIFQYENTIYRKSGSRIHKNDSCSAIWNEVYNPPNATLADFTCIGQDTFLFITDEAILGVSSLNDTILSQKVNNAYEYSNEYDEYASGVAYIGGNGRHRYRRLINGELIEMNFKYQSLQRDRSENIYSNVHDFYVRDTIFYSRDWGTTWTFEKFPPEVEGFSYFDVVTEDVLVYRGNGPDKLAVSLNYGQEIYKIPEGILQRSISFVDYSIAENKLLFYDRGEKTISYFDFGSHEFHIDVYQIDGTEIEKIFLDEEGTIFMIDEGQDLVRVRPFPYDTEVQIIIPDNFIKRYSEVESGMIVLLYDLGDHQMIHVDKYGVITYIPLDPVKDLYINGLGRTKAGHWLIYTSQIEKERFFKTHEVFPLRNSGNKIIINVLETNSVCVNEKPISSRDWKVKLSNGEQEYLAFGQPDGKISLRIPNGEYSINVNEPSYTEWTACQWPTQLVVHDTIPDQNIDIRSHFENACDALKVSLNGSIHRRCFNSRYYVEFSNVGVSTIQQATVELDLATGIEFVGSDYPYSIENGKYKFDFANIVEGENFRIPVDILTTCELNLGDLPCSNISVEVNSACSELSYSDIFCSEVIGSWDPNDKSAINMDSRNVVHFEKGEFVQYKIRFQNTGSDTAFTVRLEDCLDVNLDLLTFEVVSSSHDYEFRIDAKERQLNVLFDDIKLVDSASNEALSHGYFEFRILPIEGINVNDTLRNLADIFFDFNAPIRTNEVFLWKDQSSEIERINPMHLEVKCFPNPANELIEIEIIDTPSSNNTIAFYSVKGVEVLKRKIVGSTCRLSVNHLESGLYFVNVHSSHGEKWFKVVIQ